MSYPTESGHSHFILETLKLVSMASFFLQSTSPQSFLTDVFLFVGSTTLGTLINFDWLVHLAECSNVSNTYFNLQKGLFCLSSLGMYTKYIMCRKKQGSKGIRQWQINWSTSPMMIHKITHLKITISGWNVCTIKLNELTNQNSIIVPKVVKPRNEKTLL